MHDQPGIHLIGSVAMDSAEEVFLALATALGPWLARIPDGETGERHRWIYWQREMLLRHPDLEIDPDATPLRLTQWDGTLIRHTELLRFRPGVDPARVRFATGYAEAALASWKVFERLRDAGRIPAGVRFQVCLPTPMASGYMYIAPASLADYLPAYERALTGALAAILAGIPHEDLSIQWDVCQEVLVFENYFPYRPRDYKAQIQAELGRLGDAVPDTVELGYHLCYGTPRDEHLVMPEDMGVLVELTQALLGALSRRLDFIHLPVPRDRSDAAYFAPLQALRLAPTTTLYLGLIHFDDHAGDMARIGAARAVWPCFGISSECGWGRTDPGRIAGLIDAHRQAIEAMTRA
ncbi:MAG: hypothetical protein IT495_14280 [Gammaproteobacteria bacterium]|nr:hypothetical protein [Gammaproteobacteria bacterium]